MSHEVSHIKVYPPRKFPLDLGTYALLKQQLIEVGADLDQFLIPVMNTHGYVQLQHNLHASAVYKPIEERIQASVIPVVETAEFTRVMREWVALATQDASFLHTPHSKMRTVLAEKLGGQRFLAVLDDYQKRCIPSIQQLGELYTRYTQGMSKRDDLTVELTKFTDEWPIGHELQSHVNNMMMGGLDIAIVSIINYYSTFHVPGGVQKGHLLDRSTALKYLDIRDAYIASKKRVAVTGNLITTHSRRLIALRQHAEARETERALSHENNTLTPSEQAYQLMKHTFAHVQLDIDDFSKGEKLHPLDIEHVQDEYLEALERQTENMLSESNQMISLVQQRWKGALQANPSMTLKQMSLVGRDLYPPSLSLDTCVTFNVIMLRGYLEWINRSFDRFEELAKLLHKYRGTLFVHHETEFMTLYTRHGVSMRQILRFIDQLSVDLIPDVCMKFALAKDAYSKLDRLTLDYNATLDKLISLRKSSIALYNRVVDDRNHAESVRLKAETSLSVLPTPVSYPKMDSHSEVGIQRRLTKKVKTRGAAAAAAAAAADSSSSSNSSSSDDDDDDDDGDPRLDKERAIEALRAYYKKQNPTWKAKLVRAAAKNEWWAQQKREEERKHEIEEMRQRVANLNTADELPSFTAHPPNLPHPRSFAALSAAQPSSTSSSSSSAVRPNQPMSIDQFWAWQEEDARKRAAELRALKRKQQQQQQSKRK